MIDQLALGHCSCSWEPGEARAARRRGAICARRRGEHVKLMSCVCMYNMRDSVSKAGERERERKGRVRKEGRRSSG